MSQIIIEPGNPNDFTADELDELSELLCEQDSSLDVRVAIRPERGYGVTLFEVLRLWVAFAGGVTSTAGVGVLLKTAGKWAQDRWRRDRDEHPGQDPRPRIVEILGPDGLPISQVRIDTPDGEPREERSERREPRRKPESDPRGQDSPFGGS